MLLKKDIKEVADALTDILYVTYAGMLIDLTNVEDKNHWQVR